MHIQTKTRVHVSTKKSPDHHIIIDRKNLRSIRQKSGNTASVFTPG